MHQQTQVLATDADDNPLLEEWGGHVLTRRYQGRCDDPSRGAAAVRYMCQESEQIIDTAAEG